ncbi:MAG: hypothetical protein ACRC8S_16215 [Fimbriiglobus sp.]
MRKTWIHRLIGATALSVAMFWTLPTDAADLPEGNAALDTDVAFLQKGLAKEPQKREISTLKAVAMMVAANAQSSKNLAQRDVALAIAGAMAKKDFAEAKKLAGELAKAKGSDGKAVDLAKQHSFSLDELMSTFRKGTVGGLNLEADIRAQAKAVTDVKAAGVIGGRIALIGEYTLALPPENNNAEKKKQWDNWSKEMTELGLEIAKEAAKGDKASKPELAKKMKALDVNCTACHNVFRQ